MLGVSVINIGSRQNKRQRAANVIDCGYSQREIESSIKIQIEKGHYEPEYIYGDGFAEKKLHKYYQIVN